MKTLTKILLVIVPAMLLSAGAIAADNTPRYDAPAAAEKPKKPASSWTFVFDNDVLVPGSRDQDYTYGMNLTLAGPDAKKHLASMHGPLARLDRLTGFDDRGRGIDKAHKIEFGLFGFTPEDISLDEPETGDRPYASLVFVSSATEYYKPGTDVSWQSSLTVGMLGLSIVGDIQETVHDVTDSEEPEGWDTQISDGGEPTAQYTLSRQKLMYQDNGGLEIKSTALGSVGFITEASWSLSLRKGNIRTPWISFNPELTSYGQGVTAADQRRVAENYFWAGFSVKARAYNAFIQGQFRDSDVSYDSDELNHEILEAWAGYTVALNNGYKFTYLVRGHTSELEDGPGDRTVIWGGLQISRALF